MNINHKLPEFKLPQGLRYAWLLRNDVRKQCDVNDIEAQKDFLVWWVIYGQYEYPGAEKLSNSSKAILFESLTNSALSTGYFGMNRIMNYLLATRQDLAEKANTQSIEGVIDLNSWLYVYGLREHKLLDIIDDQTLIELNKPIVDLLRPAEFKGQKLVKMSPLMFFVYRMRQDVQQVFDINLPEQREKYIAWFFIQAVQEFDLANLINAYWKEWLLEEITLLQGTQTVPRIGRLIWESRQDIQSAFDLKTQPGCLGLINWVTENLANEASVQWLFLEKKQNTKREIHGVNLIGFAMGELGIGEDVRMAAAACDQLDIKYKVVNISPGGTVRENDKILSGSIVDALKELEYPVNVFCLTGFDTAMVYLKKGSELFKGRYNIGWWPWELPVWPEQWVDVFDLVDEVWAATKFTQKMYLNATDKPVTLMPLPVSVDRMEPVARSSFDLPDNVYLFLYIFDFNSYLPRKNPHAAVKAFMQAFPKGNEPVSLVLKTMNSYADNPQWKSFQQLCNQDKRIVLIEETLDREIVLGLVNCCDAYVSLHRAEGFGRTLAEAMMLGKPVVATDFSGNADFVHEPLGFPVKWRKKKVKQGEYPFITDQSEAYWAEPSIKHAATQMFKVFNVGKNEQQSKEIKQYAQQQFSLRRIGELIKCRLQEII